MNCLSRKLTVKHKGKTKEQERRIQLILSAQFNHTNVHTHIHKLQKKKKRKSVLERNGIKRNEKKEVERKKDRELLHNSF